ncbi:sensor domain-containing diguanylate cyclase [Vibrio sonorensis]|uniref:sensor domain-containing diguanylate cyclase n=1 Tax=Vibrio sonorensis TaxID=1004316 RepID=UPI0008D9D22B|nr:sensor domain-containing diguanylate cyclase [Vibrio sonorensis]
MIVKSLINRYTVKLVLLVALLLNVAVLSIAFMLNNHVNALEKLVIVQSPEYFNAGQSLTNIERSFGYVGFIHHFKNYVLRGDEKYYQKANQAFDKVNEAIDTFQSIPVNQTFDAEIRVIRDTLNQYRENLDVIKNNRTTLSIDELDRLVKVDDTQAELALISIQRQLLPPIEDISAHTENTLTELSRNIWTFNIVLVPLIIFVSAFIVEVLTKLTKVSYEMARLLNITPDAVIYLDDDGKVLKANRKSSQLFGYSKEQFRGLYFSNLVCKEWMRTNEVEEPHVVDFLRMNKLARNESNLIGVDKDGISMALNIVLSSDVIKGQKRTVCIVRDMRDFNQLKLHAEKDHLTQLYNRRYFEKVFDIEYSKANQTNTELSLLLIDIDDFKAINDEFGHSYGDAVLQKTARFLSEHTRKDDFVCRWGGDEFIMLCPGMNVRQLHKYAQRLTKGFQNEVDVAAKITLSIGLACTSDFSVTTKKDLFEQIDSALYRSKRNGKNCVSIVHKLHDKLTT